MTEAPGAVWKTIAVPNTILSRVTICLLVLLAAPAGADAQRRDSIGAFEITRFEVDGNTLLKPSTVASVLAGYTGRERHFDDIERAIQVLETAYRKQGFSLVKVILPEQELNQGVVHLKVIETRIGKIRVAGNSFHSVANIRRSLPALEEGVIPNTGDLSADIRISNENPSKKVNLQLQSGERPGVIDAVVQVIDDKTWTAGALLDNSGVDSSGRTHVTAQYQNFNLWGLDHVFSMQYTTSTENPSKISVYGAGYHVPLYADGDSLDFYGSYSNVNAGSVSAGLLNLTVSGAGTVFGAHFTHELPRVGRYDSQLVVGLDRKEFRNDVALQGLQLGGDVTIDPLSLSYVGQWGLPVGNLNFYLTGVRNVPGGAHASDADFTAARFGATSSYSLWRYGAGFTRTLPQEWLMRLTLNGQATHDALIPGEQFGVGGAASVRGLQERDISNDAGFTANAELYTPNLCAAAQGAVTRCSLLAFIDQGHLSRNDALPGEATHDSVTSGGLGFRLTSGRMLSLQMDYGQVITASQAPLRGERRLHALLAVAF
jgi:hemolysin activation/secretion protein